MVIFEKRKDDTQDFDISFVGRLAKLGDTASSFTIDVDPGITVVSSALTAGVVKVWLSGGNSDVTYNIKLVLTTVGARVWRYDLSIKVKG